ncbi:MAG: glycosyltransferase family 1 protein, partial [bacterium]|nr:glycosyltransferase family 1 protein [bacterium]
MGNLPQLNREPKLCVVMFSSQPWADTWTNKHHIAVRLARAGHQVIYVEPTGDEIASQHTLLCRLKQLLRGESDFPYLVSTQETRLTVIRPPYFTPRRFGFVRALTRWFFDRIAVPRAFRIARWLSAGDKPIAVWVYRPEVVDTVLKHDYDILVFDCVDDIPQFPYYRDRPAELDRLQTTQNKLLDKADLVFATAAPLADKLREKRETVHLVHNVGDARHFAKTRFGQTEVPRDIERLKQPVLGYVGAVGRFKLDTELLSEIARKKPEWSLVFIGDVDAGSPEVNEICELSNVHALGRKSYNELPGYVKGFDICLIPFKVNEINASSFPIKFFEYMATGKPLITTPIGSLREYADLVPQ